MHHSTYEYLLPQPSRNKSASCYFINFDFYLNEDSEPVKERIAPGHQDILLLPVTGKAWKKKVDSIEKHGKRSFKKRPYFMGLSGSPSCTD